MSKLSREGTEALAQSEHLQPGKNYTRNVMDFSRLVSTAIEYPAKAGQLVELAASFLQSHPEKLEAVRAWRASGQNKRDAAVGGKFAQAIHELVLQLAYDTQELPINADLLGPDEELKTQYHEALTSLTLWLTEQGLDRALHSLQRRVEKE